MSKETNALEKKFSDFCDENIYKKTGLVFEKINGKYEQEKFGDKKIHYKDDFIYVEEKSASYIHACMVIEIIQDLETCNLGWFFKYEKVNCIFYGYYKTIENELPEIVYLVLWEKLKTFLLDRIRSGEKINTGITIKHYGMTFNIYYPWDILLRNSIAEIKYENKGIIFP